MSSKSFTLNSIIPSISSTTKTTSGRPYRPSASVRAGARVARPAGRAGNGAWVKYSSALGVIGIVLSLGMYIYTINASVSKGYELKQQQALMDELNETQKRLVVQQAALGSIVKVNDVASTAGMVPVTGEEFLVANQISSR